MMGAFFLSICSASAHISYTGRDLGTWTYSAGNWSITGNSGNLTNGNVSVTVKNISKDYGWAKAANTDSGDSHDGGWFRLAVNGATGAFVITAIGGTTNAGTRAGIYPFDNSGPRFLPAFTVYSGLAVSNAHEGALDALGDTTLANDESQSGELLYVGHAADGVSANYGSNPDIEGDGVSDGIVKKTFTLQTGIYSIFVGGGNNGGSDIGNYGVNLAIRAAALPVITSSLNKTGTTGEDFSYTITATNAPTIYGAEGLPSGLSFTTSTGVISGIPTTAGNSSISITATNNDGATGSATLLMSITPPVPLINSPASANGTFGSSFNYQITASRAPTSFGAVGLPAGISVDSSTGIISGTPTQSGLFASTISATNSHGTGSRSLEITILPQAPVISSAATADGTVGSAFSHQITASNSPISYSITGALPAGLSLNATSGLISGTPSAAGNTTVTIGVTNGGGSGNQSLTLRILAQAPVISSAATANGTVGSAFSHQITASNSPISYSITGTLPSGLSLNATSGLISGTPSAAGNATVTISAINSGGSGSASLFIEIAEASAPSPPEIISHLTTSGRVGSAFSYKILGSNSPTLYSLSGSLPQGLTFNATTGRINGTPAEPGDSILTIGASNSGGSTTQSLAIQILPLPPNISSAATVNGTIGSAFSHQITANNNPTSYSVYGTLPAGLSLNATSGLISGTPSVAGNATVIISATNAGGAGNQSFSLRILAQAPVISSVATANGTVGSAFSHQITANNIPTSYSVYGTLPAGLSLNATSGLISGTPSAVGNASVTVIATNAGGSGSQPLSIQILALQSEPTDPNEPSRNPNPPSNSSPSPTSGGASSPGGPSAAQKSGKAISTKKAKGYSTKKSKSSSKKAKGYSTKKAKKKSN